MPKFYVPVMRTSVVFSTIPCTADSAEEAEHLMAEYLQHAMRELRMTFGEEEVLDEDDSL